VHSFAKMTKKSYHLILCFFANLAAAYYVNIRYDSPGHASFVHLLGGRISVGHASQGHKSVVELHQSALLSSLKALDQITLSIEKPMGIVIEEIDFENSKAGVRIASINPEGNAAKAMSTATACVNDIILAINGVSCQGKDFDQIMDEIIASSSSSVTLTLGRDSNATVISFPNGVNVVAKPGEYLGNIAQTAQYRKISYKCRAGGCGTCEQSVEVDGKGPRLMRPCVAQVQKGCRTIKFF
jgi:hypothetical protein